VKRSVRIMPAVVGMCALVALSLGCGTRQPTPPPGLNEAQLTGAEQYAIAVPAVSGKPSGYAGKVNEATLASLAQYMLVHVQ
jgi:hypothetical protein